MKKSTKIWLWIALVLCAATTALNASSGRYLSVVIALGGIAGLCLLLFREKKAGFYLLCGCYALAFLNGAVSGVLGGTGVVLSVVMSLIDSLLVPGITWLFLRSQLAQLK